ncbi:pur operon repressor [Caldicellulosiruptoraceae bacterium PP1]
MDKIGKSERIAFLSSILTQNPFKIYNFNFFCDRLGCAKSTLSEDIDFLSKVFLDLNLGKIVTISGAAGGVYFVPDISSNEVKAFLNELCNMLSNPERIVPGGFIYINDIVYNPEILKKAAKVFLKLFADFEIDYIATVEAKGIALASSVSSIMNKPLVVARSGSKLTEGSTVNIYYVSGTTGKIETMTIAKRAVKKASKVLFIDDFMRGGGTVKGMKDLMNEFESELIGVGVLISTGKTKEKNIDNCKPLLLLDQFDVENKILSFKVNNEILGN